MPTGQDVIYCCWNSYTAVLKHFKNPRKKKFFAKSCRISGKLNVWDDEFQDNQQKNFCRINFSNSLIFQLKKKSYRRKNFLKRTKCLKNRIDWFEWSISSSNLIFYVLWNILFLLYLSVRHTNTVGTNCQKIRLKSNNELWCLKIWFLEFSCVLYPSNLVSFELDSDSWDGSLVSTSAKCYIYTFEISIRWWGIPNVFIINYKFFSLYILSFHLISI